MPSNNKNKKAVAKTERTNTPWLKNAVRSIGQIGYDGVLKQYMPTVTSFSTDATKTVAAGVKQIRQSKMSVNKLQQALSKNQYVGAALKAYSNVLSDLKSGNFNNVERQNAAFLGESGDSGGSSADDEDSGFSFGDDDTDSSESTNTVIYREDNSEQTAALVTTINNQTKAQVETSRAKMQAQLAISSTFLSQSQTQHKETLDALTQISGNLEALVAFNNDTLGEYIKKSMAFMERMGSKAEEEDDTSNRKMTAADVVDTNKGGISLDAYTKYVSEQSVAAIKNIPGLGMLASVLSDKDTLNALIANPLGEGLKMAADYIIPNVVEEAMTNVEDTFRTMAPHILMRIGRMYNSGDQSPMGMLKNFFAQTFGLSLDRQEQVDVKSTIKTGPVPFDGITRHTIAEIIPHELREQTTYLRAIADKMGADTEKARGQAKVFDFNKAEYRTVADVQSSFVDEFENTIVQSFDGLFTDLLTEISDNISGGNTKKQEQVKRVVNELLLRAEGKSGENGLSFGEGEEYEELIKSMEGDKTIVAQIDKALREARASDDRKKQNALNDASRGLIAANAERKRFIQDVQDNPYEHNLYSQELRNEEGYYLTDLALNKYRGKPQGKVGRIITRAGDAVRNFADNVHVPGVGNIGNSMSNAAALAPQVGDVMTDSGILIRQSALSRREPNRKDQTSSQQQTTTPAAPVPAPTPESSSGGGTETESSDDEAAAARRSRSVEDQLRTFGQGALVTTVGIGQALVAALTGQGGVLPTLVATVKEGLVTPMKKILFGEGDERGLLSGVKDSLTDAFNSIKHTVTGKGYTDSEGNQIADTEDSLFGSLKNVGTTIKTSVMNTLFGKDIVDENGNPVTDENGNNKREKGLLDFASNTLKQGLQGWNESLFGDEAEQASLKENIGKTMKKYLPTVLGGAAAGIGLSAITGGSLVGMALGGPLGAASIGIIGGLVAKSKGFQNYLFGEEILDDEGNVTGHAGGLISAETQKFFSDNKDFFIGGAALGAIGGTLTGGGLLGTIVGGPIAGSLIGLGTSIVLKSDTFKNFLFGEEDDEGNRSGGILDKISTSFASVTNKITQNAGGAGKVAGMAALGVGAGALTGALVSKMGILGSALGPMGVVGGSILGLGLAIKASQGSFRNWLFGSDSEENFDENGEKKDIGIIGRFGKMVDVEFMQPIKTELKYFIEDAKITLKYDVLGRVSHIVDNLTEPLRNFGGYVKDNFTKTITGFMDSLTPTLEQVRDVIIAPFRTVTTVLMTAGYRYAKAAITMPFRVVEMITSPIVQKVLSAVASVGSGLKTLVSTVIGKPLGLIATGVGTLLGNAVEYGKYYILEPLKIFALGIARIPGAIYHGVTGFVSKQFGRLTSFISDKWHKSTDGLFSGIRKAFDEKLITPLSEKLSPIFDPLKEGFSDLAEKLKKDVTDGVKDAFKILTSPLWLPFKGMRMAADALNKKFGLTSGGLIDENGEAKTFETDEEMSERQKKKAEQKTNKARRLFERRQEKNEQLIGRAFGYNGNIQDTEENRAKLKLAAKDDAKIRKLMHKFNFDIKSRDADAEDNPEGQGEQGEETRLSDGELLNASDSTRLSTPGRILKYVISIGDMLAKMLGIKEREVDTAEGQGEQGDDSGDNSGGGDGDDNGGDNSGSGENGGGDNTPPDGQGEQGDGNGPPPPPDGGAPGRPMSFFERLKAGYNDSKKRAKRWLHGEEPEDEEDEEKEEDKDNEEEENKKEENKDEEQEEETEEDSEEEGDEDGGTRRRRRKRRGPFGLLRTGGAALLGAMDSMDERLRSSSFDASGNTMALASRFGYKPQKEESQGETDAAGNVVTEGTPDDTRDDNNLSHRRARNEAEEEREENQSFRQRIMSVLGCGDERGKKSKGGKSGKSSGGSKLGNLASGAMSIMGNLTSLATGFTSMFSVKGLITVGLLALAPVILSHLPQIWAGIKAVGGVIRDYVWPAIKKVGEVAYTVVVDYVWPAVKKVGEVVYDIAVNYVWPAIKKIGEVIVDVVWPAVKSVVMDYIWPGIKKVGEVISDYVWPAIKTIGGGIWEAVKTVGGFIKDYVWPVIKTVGGVISDYVWPAIKTIGGGIWSVLKTIGGVIKNYIWPIAKAIGSVVWNVDKFLVGTLFKVIKVVGGGMWTVLKTIGGFISKYIWPVIKTIASGIGSVLKVAGGIVKGIGSIIAAPFKAIAKFLGGGDSDTDDEDDDTSAEDYATSLNALDDSTSNIEGTESDLSTYTAEAANIDPSIFDADDSDSESEESGSVKNDQSYISADDYAMGTPITDNDYNTTNSSSTSNDNYTYNNGASYQTTTTNSGNTYNVYGNASANSYAYKKELIDLDGSETVTARLKNSNSMTIDTVKCYFGNGIYYVKMSDNSYTAYNIQGARVRSGITRDEIYELVVNGYVAEAELPQNLYNKDAWEDVRNSYASLLQDSLDEYKTKVAGMGSTTVELADDVEITLFEDGTFHLPSDGKAYFNNSGNFYLKMKNNTYTEYNAKGARIRTDISEYDMYKLVKNGDVWEGDAPTIINESDAYKDLQSSYSADIRSTLQTLKSNSSNNVTVTNSANISAHTVGNTNVYSGKEDAVDEATEGLEEAENWDADANSTNIYKVPKSNTAMYQATADGIWYYMYNKGEGSISSGYSPNGYLTSNNMNNLPKGLIEAARPDILYADYAKDKSAKSVLTYKSRLATKYPDYWSAPELVPLPSYVYDPEAESEYQLPSTAKVHTDTSVQDYRDEQAAQETEDQSGASSIGGWGEGTDKSNVPSDQNTIKQTKPADISEGFKYYSQTDPKWSTNRYSYDSDNGTIGNAGCAPTSMAMIASQFIGRDVDPREMSKFAAENGYRDGTGTNSDFINAAASAYGIKHSKKVNPSAKAIETSLQEGKPVVLAGKGSGSSSPFTEKGHYVVATGIDEHGKVKVNDPRGSKYNKKYDVEDLSSETNIGWQMDPEYTHEHGLGDLDNAYTSGSYKVTEDGDVKTTKINTGGSLSTAEFDVPSYDDLVSGNEIFGGIYYSQSGEPWSSIPFAGSTVGSVGCTQTSISMGAASLTGQDLNPSIMYQKYPDTFTSGGTDWSTFFNHLKSDYNIDVNYASSMDEAKTALAAGKPVLMYSYPDYSGLYSSGSGGGHMILGTVSDTSGQNVYILDPGYKSRMSSSQYYKRNIADMWNARRATTEKPGWAIMSRNGAGIQDLKGGFSSLSTSASASAANGTGGDGSASTSSSTGLLNQSGNVITKIASFLGEAASRFVTGALTGNFDSDYTDYLYGTTSSTSSSGGSSVGTYSGDVTLSGSNYTEQIWNYFKDQGFTDAGVAGAMGNLEGESGNDPVKKQSVYDPESNQAYMNRVNSGEISEHDFVHSGDGYGLAQWTYYTRKQGLYDNTVAQGKSIGDLGGQLGWLMAELNDGYTSTLNTVRSSNDVGEATRQWCVDYERPADQSSSAIAKRAAFGQGYYDMYSGKLTGSGSTLKTENDDWNTEEEGTTEATTEESTSGTGGFGMGTAKVVSGSYTRTNADGTISQAKKYKSDGVLDTPNTETIVGLLGDIYGVLTTIATNSNNLAYLKNIVANTGKSSKNITVNATTNKTEKESSSSPTIITTNGSTSAYNGLTETKLTANHKRAIQIAKG